MAFVKVSILYVAQQDIAKSRCSCSSRCLITPFYKRKGQSMLLLHPRSRISMPCRKTARLTQVKILRNKSSLLFCYPTGLQFPQDWSLWQFVNLSRCPKKRFFFLIHAIRVKVEGSKMQAGTTHSINSPIGIRLLFCNFTIYIYTFFF